MYLLITILLLGLTILYWKRESIRSNFQLLKDTCENKFILYAISKIAKQQAESHKKEPYSLHIADNCKHVTIKLENKIVILPYDLNLSFNMNNNRFYIKYPEKDEAERVHLYPGIHLHITADHLDAEYIEVIDEDNISKKFTGTDVIEL